MCGIRKSSLKTITYALMISLFFIVMVSGCRGKKAEITPELASSAEAMFREGEKYLKKDPERSRLYFRQVIDSFPQSFYAQQSKLAIADSYFRKGDAANMILAASEYREFINLFPFSPSTPYAQYQIAMTFYKKIYSPGRDQTKTQQALEEFKKVLTNYPTSDEAKETQEKILDCEDKLASHAFQIGLHYYKVGSYRAAIIRLREILTAYPNYSGLEQVYYYLGASFYGGKNYPQSSSFFTKLISDYPQSKFAKKARKKLYEIEKKTKEAEKKAPQKKNGNRKSAGAFHEKS
ncbi:MAG: outer membrane protein assembly factor BamD [Candidatus Aminicenantes bacterium]|nr:outer membrane protein assembly factor BamD [Candidatus Aminicenantes bacterium]